MAQVPDGVKSAIDAGGNGGAAVTISEEIVFVHADVRKQFEALADPRQGQIIYSSVNSMAMTP